MKLLFYSPQTLPSIGGLQYVVHYWAEAMVHRGHEVVVISETAEKESGAELQVAYATHRNIPFQKQVALMRAADCIIMFNVSLKGLPAVLLSGKPLYLSHHTALWYDGGPRPRRQRIKQWVANRLAKNNCACSAYIAHFYEKCRVIHSPYRADIFFRGSSIRKPGSIVFAGRLVSDKGADLLIEAFARLVQEGLAIQLTIVGDGPERERLEGLALKLGLHVEHGTGAMEPQPGDSTRPGLQAPEIEETLPFRCVETRTGASGSGDVAGNGETGPFRCVETRTGASETRTGASETRTGASGSGDVTGNRYTQTQTASPLPGESEGWPTLTFTGSLPQPHLVRLLQSHAVMVVPSRMEPMGMIVAEGLACGCNMVVSNQGGMPEVGGAFCRYFDSENVDSLAKALRLQLTAPLPVAADALQQHLEKFTVEYSVRALEKWLGVTPLTPLTGENR